MKRHALTAAFSLVVCFSAFAPACGSETEANSDPDASANGDGSPVDPNNPDGSDSSAPSDAAGGYDGNSYNGNPGSCTPLVDANGNSPQCANCKDDDGDTLVDWLDPECAGPLDNDEATFGTGIPGDNVDACKQDCFFDGNSGAGDDKCEWNLKCDPKNTSPSSVCKYDPNYKNCPATQTDQCVKFCAALTPNGCDCFGCCTITKADGSTKDVMLSSTCSIKDIDDPAKCAACTKNTACQNDCGKCELCLGKTTIDPSCNTTADAGTADGGGDPLGGQTCSIPGAQACNAQVPCPSGTYCVTGCCIQIVN